MCKKCNAGEKRNTTFKCRPTKKLCESEKQDFNRFTKKCIKKCDIDKKRVFYCPTKTKGIHYNALSLSRNTPCDKSQFGKFKKEDLPRHGRILGKYRYSRIGKNYGTLCRPKCNSFTSKYNVDTNRCRENSWWSKVKRIDKKNEK
jgi:hypothetical protein